VVVAIGDPLLVERHDEQVAALELAQPPFTVTAAGERIAQ
jgi:hypothetical protein